MTVLKSVSLFGETSTDITIVDGKIASLEPSSESGIDCSGLIALPGLVDLHTHLRQPGFEASETVASGSRSAAAGGYTAVFAMANTNPVGDSPAVVEQVLTLGQQAGLVQVQPIGAVTKGLAGTELSSIAAMAKSKARVRVFSDDGMCVHDPALMLQALSIISEFDGVLAQHAQEPKLTEGAQMNDSALSVELGLAGWPGVAEEAIVARDVLLAQKVGARLHVCHLTTAGAVEVVRWAKARGIKVTAEVTPHHLMLTEDLVRSYDPVYKVNPPLRTKEDTLALQQGLLDGTIDIVATDHAPHSDEKKECEWESAAFGMVGLENAASVVQQVLIEQGATWHDLGRVMSSKPAEIGGLANHGQLSVGSEANLILIDPSVKRRIRDKSQSLSQNNPFANHELPGEVVHTIFRGEFSVFDKAVSDRG